MSRLYNCRCRFRTGLRDLPWRGARRQTPRLFDICIGQRCISDGRLPVDELHASGEIPVVGAAWRESAGKAREGAPGTVGRGRQAVLLHQQLPQGLVLLPVGLDDELRADEATLIGDQGQALQCGHTGIPGVEGHGAFGAPFELPCAGRRGCGNERSHRCVLQPHAVEGQLAGARGDLRSGHGRQTPQDDQESHRQRARDSREGVNVKHRRSFAGTGLRPDPGLPITRVGPHVVCSQPVPFHMVCSVDCSTPFTMNAVR